MIAHMLNAIVRVILVFIMSFAVHAQENILIYSGPGAGAQSVANTVATIKQLTNNKYKILTIGPEVLVKQAWLQTTSLLIMPGGADRPYLEKLSGKGNENIRAYVNGGGKFLGICAGAYYAGDRLEFAKGDPELEVTGERELKFFPGLISGPTYAGYDHRDINIHAGTRAAKLYWNLEQPFGINKEFYIFYNGGGSFVDAEKYSTIQILARYSPEVPGDTVEPAAIIECSISKGTAILSGLHFEWRPETLDDKSEQYRKIKPQLIDANKERLNLVRHLLTRLNIDIN